jgi:phosphate-selective porin
VGAFNGNGVNNNFNDDDRFMVAGRLAGVAWEGKVRGQAAKWSLGGNGFTSDDTSIPMPSEFNFDSTPATPERDNVFAGRRQALGLDSQLLLGRWEFWAEYLSTRFEPDSGRPARRFDSDGWYAQAAYYLIAERFQAVARFETFDPNEDLLEDETDEAILGATWYLKGHDLKLLLNVIRAEGPGTTPTQDKVLARLQVIF